MDSFREEEIDVVISVGQAFDAKKLKNVPVTAFPVQPERKRGKWIDTGCNEEWWAREYRCSECGDTMLGDANFCPNCGADMRGVTD